MIANQNHTMDPRAVDSFGTKLEFVAENLIFAFGHPQTGCKILGVGDSAKSFTFTPEGWKTHKEVLSTLLKKYRWSETFSEKHLDNKLVRILQKALDAKSTAPIRQEFKALVHEVETYSIELSVYVPLVGLRMHMKELQIGNVRIINMTEESAALFKERCRSIIMRNTYYNDEQKLAIFADQEKHWIPNVLNRVCAEVKVIAESNRAAERALDETRGVVDLLRFAILFLDPDRDRKKDGKNDRKKVVGIQGDSCEDPRTIVCINDDVGVNYLNSLVNYRFDLHEQVVESMRELGVFVLSDLMQKSIRTEFEDVILRAVHWLSSAQAQEQKENALLNLVTCLETFMKPLKGDPITAIIAEGVAILTEDTLEKRKYRKNRIKEFYQKRSTLTHEGDGEILLSELDELTEIARDLTINMIRRRNEFQTQEDLRNWIEDQKLGGR